MPRIVIVFLLCIWIISGSFRSPDPIDELVGKWRETWGVGQKTDVTYHDEFVIRTISKAPGISISCGTHTYSFQSIRFDGRHLDFVKLNDSYKLPYHLQLSPGGNLLMGSVVNIHGKTDNIRWEKMP